MSRALKFTLLIGVWVSVVLGAFFWSGWLHPLDVRLAGRVLGLEEHWPEHPAWQVLAFAGMAFGIAWTTIDINRPLFKTVIAALALGEIFTFCVLLAVFDVYFSPILPAVAVLMSFAAGYGYAQTRTGQRQRVVDWAFGRRVSRGQTRALVDGSAVLEHGGQIQELTLVVCEIFNHQELMEELEPAAYAAISNQFTNCAAEVLVDKGGTLAACDGEGVRVIFGAPLPLASHAASGCRAALEVARQIKLLNEQTAREHGGLTCDLRIGINSGEMAVGHFGSRRLGGFGVAGEEVAFARRLCAANLVYGSTILLGARTFELAEAAIEARPLELLRRRIGDNWLEVYELLAEPQQLSPADLERRDLFWTGVIFYREKRLRDALEKFQQARAGGTAPDGPLDFYIQRIKQIQHSNTTTDWDTARLLNSL